MKYIDQWLTGLGLEYILPKLKDQGITTPKRLAQLSLRDIYEIVGVEEPEDRKKLYYLIQRLQTILAKEQAGTDSGSTNNEKKSSKSSESIPDNTDDGIEPKPSAEPNLNLSPEPKLKPNNKLKAEIRREAAAALIVKSNDDASSIKSFKVDESISTLGSEDDIKILRMKKKSLNIQTENDKETAANQPIKKSIRSPNSTLETNYRGPVPISKPFPQPKISDAKADDLSIDFTKQNSKLLLPQQTKNANKKSSPIKSNESKIKSPLLISPMSDLENEMYLPNKPINNYQNEFKDEEVEDMQIRVVVRKRPISVIEMNRGDRDVMDISKGGSVVIHEPKVKVDLSKVVESHEFIFDDAFDANDSNEAIYNRTVRSLVASIFVGGKASCFAYGQTGSGKTFTMMGSDPGNPSVASKNAGLYVLAARDIFALHSKPSNKNFKIYCSCFEIYGGKLFDLLNERTIVKCLEDSKQQVHLSGLSEHDISSVQELLELMKRAHSVRSTGSTGANLESSRSHQVLQIRVGNAANPVMNDAKARRPGGVIGKPTTSNNSSNIGGKLSFIDLAGSERGADVTNSSKQTRLEGAEINTSLLALKEVIRSLVYRKSNPTGHTPFRGSKLTQVLKDSFIGENTRTCMVACVSPSQFNCEHTLNTLRYADRVKEHAQQGPLPSRQASNNSPFQPLLQENNNNTPPTPQRISESKSKARVYESKDDDEVQSKSKFSMLDNDAVSSFSNDNITRPKTSPSKQISSEKSKKYVEAESKDSDFPPKLLASNEKLQLAFIKQKSGLPSKRGSFNNYNNKNGGVNDNKINPSDQQNIEEEMKNCHIDSLNINSPPSSPPRGMASNQDALQSEKHSVMVQKTVNMLSSHRSTITDMVEIMKEEMELVQNMENIEERDAEQYTTRLIKLLEIKDSSIQSLKNELKKFKKSRQQYSV